TPSPHSPRCAPLAALPSPHSPRRTPLAPRPRPLALPPSPRRTPSLPSPRRTPLAHAGETADTLACDPGLGPVAQIASLPGVPCPPTYHPPGVQARASVVPFAPEPTPRRCASRWRDIASRGG